MQANKNHIQDLQTAHDEHMSKLNAQTARLGRAEDKFKESEGILKAVQDRLLKVNSAS
jgi:hypothetical protein